MSFDYDNTGKIDLSDIYNNPNPVKYFSTLSRLDYRIPQEAKPVFQKILSARRQATGVADTKVVDVGCSYGVNAALLKYDLDMEDLNRHYTQMGQVTREEALARDQAFFAEPADPHLEVVGLDLAEKAVRYAVDADVLDAGVSANLEEGAPRPQDAALLSDADLVISTGCYGYVSERTLERVLDHADGRQPWMAHMVLRMFDFSDAETMLDRHGYVTEKVEGLVPQRRFASSEETENVFDNLDAAGVDYDGFESKGWYFAELFVSRPEAAAAQLPLERVVPPLSRGGTFAG